MRKRKRARARDPDEEEAPVDQFDNSRSGYNGERI
jgi:hypothetical protein